MLCAHDDLPMQADERPESAYPRRAFHGVRGMCGLSLGGPPLTEAAFDPNRSVMPRFLRASAFRRAGCRRALLLLSLLSLASPLRAQDIIRSAQPWRTLQTRWFTVHYPLDTEAWASDLAPRLDAIHDAVATLVGYAPPQRTTIVIDDPYNVSNGKALPILGAPVVHLWVTPPGPTDQIANHRGWGIKLASHEFGHIAHLSRPARRTELYWHLLPAQVSPLALFTPRWALEGYATWIEGEITGSGRPHGAWRPALLRELALAGRLPTYGALSAGGGYKGGNMAYLAGSAFWEWLAAQRGDTSMTLVFRRQSARIARSFDDAFRGVYGDAPAVLYARFSAELTNKAFAVDTALKLGGLVTGTRLARFSGFVGGPAVSADGARLALQLPGAGGASPRIVITKPDTQLVSKAEQEQQQRALRRDSQDVAAIRLYASLEKPLATLTARRGRTFANPRFIDAAGSVVLLDSWSGRADGSQRPDLAEWNSVTGRVRYVTDGAAVQDADPSPDGARGAAVRCLGGVCDLVLVSLRTGAVTTLAHGAPTTVYNHPRWSPDGRRLVVGVQERDGAWKLALVDPNTGSVTIITPDDDVNRHSASFDRTGAQLIYVSEADGIPNVESMQLSDRTRTPRTRVEGSVFEPVPLPDGAILYLSEHATGVDLFRVERRAIVPAAPRIAAVRLVPAMPRPRQAGVALPAASVGAPTAYGAGPRQYRWLAQAAMARDGVSASGALASTDPANRLTWMITGMGGTASAWRGGVASGVWYGSRPNLRAEGFWLEQRGTRQRSGAVFDARDVHLAGGSLAAELPIAGSSAAQRLGLSAFVGAAQERGFETRRRLLISAQYNAGVSTGWRAAVGIATRGAAGTLGDSSFARVSIGGYVRARDTRIDARMYRTTRATPVFEQFSAGGFAPPVSDDATLAQRVALPALPAGTVRGRALQEFRIARPVPFVPGTIYAQSVGTTWKLDEQTAVIGVENGIDLDYLGLVGLPRLHALAGVARILSGPLRHRGSAYLMIGWRP